MAAPNQLWSMGAERLRSYGRTSSSYNGVDVGNVDPGSLPITDAGQIGSANLPGLHAASAPAAAYAGATPLPNVDAMLTRDGRFNRRPVPGRWAPNVIKGYSEEAATEGGTYPNHGQNPFGIAGANEHPLQTVEHGPFTVTELAELAEIRQPQPPKARWWQRFKGAGKPLDSLNAFPEDVQPRMGIVLPDDTEYRPYDSALGTGNAFVVPDVRRTFDHPEDAQGTIRDSHGNVVVDKAGYPLTNTAAEPIPWDIKTSHAYDVSKEVDYGQISPDRVRAGVELNPSSTRPATMPHWFYLSQFDKLMADHPYGTKGMLAQPLASRPIFTKYEPVQDDGATAGGARYFAPAAGMEAAGIQPNLDRQSPAPWDANLYNNGDKDGMQRVAAAANKGWGAR